LRKNGSIINIFHIVSLQRVSIKTKSMHPYSYIESFWKIPRARHFMPWFGRSQRDKAKQNKTKQNKTNYLASWIDSACFENRRFGRLTSSESR
jgi:hypothetical protein